jgi:nitrate/nitrite-specific signal transduction histidine kinase
MIENTRPTKIHDQIEALSLQAGKVRSTLEAGKLKLPREAVEELTSLETTLARVAEKVESFEAEHRNLVALANVGQVVNSSLELDEVLRIVMDNIVRLTRAERGFLMLRDENGQMVMRMARN